MPRLVIFAACEKAIIDQSTNVASLMSLLQEINVEVPPGESVPSDAKIPMTWSIAAILKALPEDRNKRFEQRSVMTNDNGQTLLETPIVAFDMAADFHRILSQIHGMYIGSAGTYEIKCLLRETGTSEWNEVARYPIVIKWSRSSSIIQ
jgi:hypothetical protein